ncbi:hypothetical protein LAJ19_14385 (plasmid) [Deinococcus taeanensis]|uniref:hypothetical protein n=1 Tax=Deinococcus taeanensis TaxID=2737050 RepID=UPI001CDB5976|nr:hypothetical protein [Deinococcus taeanensis]UBV44352.1 hypothetical protein LAJ19_14385 [Deinococcus taeanensis]
MKHFSLPVLSLTVLLASCGTQPTPAAGPQSGRTALQRPADLAKAGPRLHSSSVLPVSEAWRGMTWRVLDQQGGVVRVGADEATDPYAGDTSATADLPLLCLNQDGRAAPEGLALDFYNGWAGGEVRATPPVNGTALTSRKAADTFCATEFGANWRMAEFHDGQVDGQKGGWRFYASGQLNREARFWVAIDDQNANPWNSDGERPDAVIPDTTRVLGEQDRAGLLSASDDGRTLVFRSDSPVLSSLKEGMALVSRPTETAPAGFLGRVSAIEVQGETTLVRTGEVTLEEIIQDGDLDAAVALDSSMIDYEKSGSAIQAQQQKLSAQKTFNFFSFSKTPFCLYDHASRNLGCDDGAAGGLRSRVPSTNYVTLDGEFNARADAFINASIRWFSLRHFDVGVELSENARVTLDGKGSYSWNVNKDLTQWQVVFSPITFFIGPVPVVITPILVPTVGTDGQITATLRYEATQSFNGRYGVQYNKGSGWSGINSNNWTFNAPPAPTVTGSAQLNASLGAKGVLAFYSASTSGPHAFVHARAFAEGQANATFTPGQGGSYSAYLDAGVRADAGVAFPLVTSSTWQTQIVDWKRRIGSWSGQIPGGGPVGPSTAYTSMTLNFTSVYGDVEVNTYDPNTGATTQIGTLSGNGTLDVIGALNPAGDTIIQVSSIARRSSGIFGSYRRNIDMSVTANGRTVYDPAPAGCTSCHSAQVYQFTVNKANGTITW